MARLAPGPSGLKLARTLRAMLADPLPVLDELQATYGDVVELRGPGVRLVVLNHPADIEQLLVGHARSTSKGSSVARMTRGMGRNLFTLEGEAHAERRRLLTPIFRPRDIAPQARWSRERAEATAASWREGEPIDVGAQMDELALNAMARALLGRDYDDEAAVLAGLVHEAVAATPTLLDPAFPLKARLWPPHGRGIDALARRWDAVCDTLIERAMAEEHARGEGPPDVLHQLLAGHRSGTALLDDQQSLREELRGLLLSAHETTALALTWTLHNLARNAEARARLTDEVDEVTDGAALRVDQLGELRYTRAALEETLRTHGGTFVPRGAETDLPLEHAGITVPAGTELLASMWTVHRDPRWWPEPDQWRPERFLEPDPARPRFAWFPFGGGRRTCIGMHLALQSAVIVLAQLHQRWRLDAVAGDQAVEPTSNVLVRPSRTVELVPIAR
ncbi:MAG: cytochrome [Thermoleophilia bacterium]|nr:cytochrome [Thermoleophilia bacterium]